MKGIAIAAVLAALVGLGTGSAAITPRGSAQSGTQGDVTCDAAVNSIDALQILRSVAGLGTPASCLTDAGDVNCDEAVNSVDSLRILRHVAGLPNATPAGCVPIGESLQRLPTSAQLIEQALAGGDIDEEEALVYKLLALFGDSRLPEEYLGDDSRIADGHVVAQAMDRFGTLSPENQATLAPFLKRPTEAGSWLDLPSVPSASYQAAAAVTWTTRTVAGGKVKVWSQDRYPADAAKADDIAAALNVNWEIASTLVFGGSEPLSDDGLPNNGGDGAVDVYLVHTAGRGVTVPANPPDSCAAFPVHVLLNSNRPLNPSGDGLVTDMAHHLFLAFQRAYLLSGCIHAPEFSWFDSASATWGEHSLYPTNDSEHTWAYSFLSNPGAPLDSPDAAHGYGAYLFPFFLTEFKFNEGVVGAIWDSFLHHADSLEAIDAVVGMEDIWEEFTTLNWNLEPVEDYDDADSIAEGALGTLKAIEPWSKQELAAEVGAMAATYHHVLAIDPAVREVKFKNTLNGVPHAHVRALVKIGDSWRPEPEDWSEDSEITFCRDYEDENVTELVIIFSNSDWQDQKQLDPDEPPTLEGSAGGCAAWEAKVNMTGTIPDSAPSWEGTITANATVRFEPAGADQLHLCAPEAACWVPVSGTMNWTESGTRGDCSTSGSGTSTETTGYFHGKLDIWYEKDGVEQDQPPYSGGANIDYRGGTNRVTCPDPDNNFETEQPFFSPWKTMAIAPWDCDGHPEFHLASPNASSASGSCTLNQPGEQEHTASWTWTIRRVP